MKNIKQYGFRFCIFISICLQWMCPSQSTTWEMIVCSVEWVRRECECYWNEEDVQLEWLIETQFTFESIDVLSTAEKENYQANKHRTKTRRRKKTNRVQLTTHRFHYFSIVWLWLLFWPREWFFNDFKSVFSLLRINGIWCCVLVPLTRWLVVKTPEL